MIKDLFLPITAAEGDSHALNAAIGLANAQSAHLVVQVTVELPHVAMPSTPALGVDLYAELYTQAQAQAEQLAADLRSRLDASGVSFEVRVESASLERPGRSDVHAARHVDLIVMTGTSVADGFAARQRVQRCFGALLLGTGRPVLMLRQGHPWVWPIRRALLAWQPTREASRALHDALPLLQACEHLEVLSVAANAAERNEAEQSAIDIASHIARYQRHVRACAKVAADATVVQTLLGHAEQVGAQLLVAGGYGHSRLRELMLGGVTRELLHSATVPVLYSH